LWSLGWDPEDFAKSAFASLGINRDGLWRRVVAVNAALEDREPAFFEFLVADLEHEAEEGPCVELVTPRACASAANHPAR
jgi:hypothetical protein